MSSAVEPSLHPDLSDRISDDDEEIFSAFMPPNLCQPSDEEVILREEIKLLKQAKRLLSDLKQELDSKRIKPEAPKKLTKTTEQAKEEAMKLIKSGVISFDTGNDRHVFKRKIKDDVDDGSENPRPKKQNLYDNFVAGPRMNASGYSTNTGSQHEGSVDNTNDPERLPRMHSSTSSDAEGDDRYRSNGGAGGGGSGGCTLYISFNDMNVASVREIMEPYGPIVNIRVDEQKCYGFVTLRSAEMAERALKLDKTRYNETRLRVNYARRQNRMPDIHFEDNAERPYSRHPPRRFSNMRRGGPPRDNHSPPAHGDERGPSPSGPANRNLVSYNDVDY